MKALIIMFALIAAPVFISCGGNGDKVKATSDSVKVDTAVVDTSIADSILADSVEVSDSLK